MAVEMRLDITADTAGASANVDVLNTKIRSLGDAATSIVGNFASLHFIFSDTMQVAEKAFESIERYAGFAEVKEQLNLMAAQYNTTGDAIVGTMKRITDGQMSLEQASHSAASALKNSLTPQQIEGLAEAAKTFNDIAGMSVPETFDRLAEAVQRGSARAAQSIVGKDGLGDAMKSLAAGADDASKSTELYEAIMAKTHEQSTRLAGSTQSLDDHIQALKAKWSDLTLYLAQNAVKVIYGMTGLFDSLAATATRAAAGVVALQAGVQLLTFQGKAAKETMGDAKDLWGSANELARKSEQYFLLAASVGAVDEQQKKLGDTVKSTRTDADDKLYEKTRLEMAKMAEEGYKRDADARRRYRQQLAAEEMNQLQKSMEAWNTYLTNLESEYRATYELLKQETLDLAKIEKDAADQYQGYITLRRGLTDQLLTGEKKYQADVKVYREHAAVAEKLSGQAQIDALTALQKERATLIDGAKKYQFTNVKDQPWIDKTVLNDAISDIDRIQKKIRDLQEQQAKDKVLDINALVAKVNTLQESITNTKIASQGALLAFQAISAELERAKALNVSTDAAMGKATELRNAIDALFPEGGIVKTITLRYKTEGQAPKEFMTPELEPAGPGPGSTFRNQPGSTLKNSGAVIYSSPEDATGIPFTPSIPSGGAPLLPSGASSEASQVPGGPLVGVTIHVAGGPNAAREIDGHLADLITSNRSRLAAALRTVGNAA